MQSDGEMASNGVFRQPEGMSMSMDGADKLLLLSNVASLSKLPGPTHQGGKVQPIPSFFVIM